ncbi:hypothetical protein ACWKWJ_07960 [Sphingopyxis terrae subsp. ummariensis]
MDTRYLLIECKSEVDVTRAEINKREAEQMNRSAAWFDKHYKGMCATRLIIHPAKRIESAAAFTHQVEGVTEQDLKRLVRACRAFFKSLEAQNFSDLSAAHLDGLIKSHKLSVEDFLSTYSRKLKDMK